MPARRSIDAPVYLSLAEAADILGQSEKTIRRRISAGVLPAYRFGPRSIRVRLDELQLSGRPIPSARMRG